MSNRLETLLNHAKQQTPLLTQSDVSAIISNKNLLVKKQTFFTLKNIFIMSVVCAVIAGLWLGFYPAPTQNNKSNLVKESVVNKQNKIAEPTIKTKQPKKNKIVDLTIKQSPLLVSKKPKPTKEIANKQEVPLFEPFNSTPKFSETNLEDNRTYFDENGYLILTNEELAKLGIITDGNVLKYENVTDTIRATQIGKMTVYAFTNSKIKYENGKYFLTHSDFKNKKKLDSNDKQFWPAALTIWNKNDSDIYILENIWSKGYDKDFFYEVKPYLIPLVVNTNNKKSVFWFKAEPLFYSALEPDVEIAVKQKYSYINHNDYIKTMVKYREIGSDRAYNKGFDEIVLKKLKDKLSLLNDDELKEIDIIKNLKTLKFKYTDIKNDTYKIVTYKKNKKDININYRNLHFWENEKKSDFLIVATSDYKLTFINYYQLYNDSISYIKKNQNAEEYFLNNLDHLIPIYIGHTVVWLEPTPKLTEIIRKHKLKIIRQDIEKRRSTNLLNFNEFELQKLGISFEKGAIKMPIISHKNNTTFIRLRKRNSSTTFIFDTLNNKKIGNKTEYAVPMLVTDKSGLNWRFYRLDTSCKEGEFSEYEISTTKKLNTCIPVKISHKNVELIAWYEPNSLFLSSLPSVQSIEIENDLEAISTNQPTISCKYFEACKNVSGKINSYLAYPNPVEQTLNIEIDLAEERNLEFIITDITGKIIKTLNQNLNQTKGIQTYTYQIGELTEGMYLLIITTNKGEKVSTRIVKK